MRPEVLTVPVLSVSVPGDWPHSPSFALRQQWDETTLGWNNRHKLPESSAEVQGPQGPPRLQATAPNTKATGQLPAQRGNQTLS